MKQFLFSIFLSIMMMNLNAQIYNSGFENWTSMGSYEVPDQWGTMNNATSHLNVFTVTKWNPGSPGAYFMKITSKMYGSNVMNGIAVYGKLDSTNMQPISGYPFTQRPASFTGQWQHMIWGTDQGSVCATLTKWNLLLNKRDTIGTAYEELVGMEMNWAPFVITFNYQSSDFPDSCMIVLRSSGNTPELNDYLWVDDLGFGGLTSVDEGSDLDYINAYPVPTSDHMTIEIKVRNPQKITYELSDISGRLILRKEEELICGENKIILNFTKPAEGVYFLRSSVSGNDYFQKILID